MNNNIEKKNYYNILYGFYYQLLTDKQQAVFESYYSSDYSITEIAENLQISRNAVWDSLQKTITLLEEYEKKLSLYQKNLQLEKNLTELEKLTNEEGQIIIKKIKEME